MNRTKTFWITQTAALIALLIVCQALTASFGNVVLTGSIVNCILVIASVTGGLTSGLTVAALSPFFASLLGIGPALALWPILICAAIGNSVLVSCWHFVVLWGKRTQKKPLLAFGIATAAAALAKFATLYTGVVVIALPLMHLAEKQTAALSASFGISQLFTAAIGGAVASLALPALLKAVKRTGA